MPPKLGPHELDDDHWKKIEDLITLKRKELGITEPDEIFLLFKRYWLKLVNLNDVEQFLDEEKLTKLKTDRNTLDANRPGLDAKILALENKLGVN